MTQDEEEEGHKSIKDKVDEALNCPCVSDLKEGPCGLTFVKAFSCFIENQNSQKVMRDVLLI